MADLTWHEKQLNATLHATPEQADALVEISELLREWAERGKEATQKRWEGYTLLDDYGRLAEAHDELQLIVAGVRRGFLEQDAEIAGVAVEDV